MAESRSVAVVAGALANKVRNGGEAWVRPTWALGLGRLGFDGWLVEELPADISGPDLDDALHWFRVVTAWFGLDGRSALVQGERSLVGPSFADLAELLGAAELFVNISGHLRRLDLPTPRARRIYLDVDPGFTQIWAARGLLDLSGHDAYVTVGTAIGSGTCPVPSCGLDWVTTLPPVLVDRWTPTDPPDGPLRATTVGSWRPPHGPVDWDGLHYGVKAHEFRRYLELPASAAPAVLELALAIDEADHADRARLLAAGFELVDPSAVAATPWAFAEYVAGSGAEWSVAQGLYVHARTGWVSDRSAHYLAAGRPVVVQDTCSFLPTGPGWWTFEEPAGAASALSEIGRDPAGASEAARDLAERHFDSDVVLASLCERLGAAA